MNVITRLLDAAAEALREHAARLRREAKGEKLTWYGRGYMDATDDLRDQDDEQTDDSDEAEMLAQLSALGATLDHLVAIPSLLAAGMSPSDIRRVADAWARGRLRATDSGGEGRG